MNEIRKPPYILCIYAYIVILLSSKWYAYLFNPEQIGVSIVSTYYTVLYSITRGYNYALV